mmetsp:Transcript_14565/g.44024  ORF Transcript_14565/g.44024 Transcript_14565/m.44024 type:complete len:89 (-) Transcript_14565:2426-2692(-)
MLHRRCANSSPVTPRCTMHRLSRTQGDGQSTEASCKSSWDMECSRRPGFPFVTVAAKAAQYFHQPHHLKEALLRFKSRSTQLKMQRQQ